MCAQRRDIHTIYLFDFDHSMKLTQNFMVLCFLIAGAGGGGRGGGRGGRGGGRGKHKMVYEMHTLSSSSIHMFLNDTKLNILLLN